MACTSSLLLQTISARNLQKVPYSARAPTPAPLVSRAATLSGRRQWLFLLTATTALKAAELPSRAEDIPLFGLRKKLRKVEEEAVEIVKEGFESAEKGIDAAEKGIVAAEKGVEVAEKEIETAVSFGGLAQAGVVAGAEVVGILVATAVVNGIIGVEGQKA